MTYSYDEVLVACIEYFNGDELAAKVVIDKYLLRNNDNELLEKTPTDMHWRIAKEFARIEKTKFKVPLTEELIFDLLNRFERIIMQGSPMYAIGNPYQICSVGNCFVLPGPLDSLAGILYTDTQITQISCRRGGVGWSNSKIRPKSTAVRNAAKTTSGMTEFMKRFSNTIREVGQFGRRGASLQSVSCFHPEILDFIKIKQDLTQVTGSNISIEFTDEFIQAVKEDKEIELRWPVSEKHAKEMKRKFPEISIKIKAKNIWEEFSNSAWQTAEPAPIFIDTVHKESTSTPYGMIEESANPCGEQLLPPYASCRLLVLNLYGYVENKFSNKAKFNFKKFFADAKLLQRLGDDLVDIEIEHIDKILEKINSDPEPKQIKRIALDLWENVRKTALLDRRTGCGFTALGDTIAALNMTYASEDSIKFAEKMQKTLAEATYTSSIEMAKELGSFPDYNSTLDIQSKFVQRIKENFPNLYSDMVKYGRRNMTLLTVAPSGSVSCLSQTTSGIEPVFNLEYKRRKKGNPGDKNFRSDFIDQSGDNWMEFPVFHKGFQDWMDFTGKKNVLDSPYNKSTANEIDWANRIKLQAAVQQFVDNSISSTINLPSNISKEKVSEIFLLAHEMGCKGITIYRDGCRTGVLINKDKSQNNKIQKTTAPKRPNELSCDIYHMTIKGEKFFVAIGLLNNEPYEVFAGRDEEFADKKAKNGTIKKLRRGHYQISTDEGSVAVGDTHDLGDPDKESLTRMISTALRHGAETKFIIAQLERNRGDMQSFAKCVARSLKKYVEDGTKITGETCENCGSENLVRAEGCKTCLSCSASKCG